jgi:hypothetical protein
VLAHVIAVAGGELLPLRPHRFALDCYAAPDNPHRMVPNPAKKAAAVQVRDAEHVLAEAEAARDDALLTLRSPAPGRAVTITNQVINTINAPIRAPRRKLEQAEAAAAAVAARIRLGGLSPDMITGLA